ncbi:MAG: FAD-dependent oxidoreductase [Thermodesulfovibrionales bacterium]|nr:FAD-dependent oxidoreductase [Thermodesulfovibrionales bacterium]
MGNEIENNLKQIINEKLPPCQKACPALTDIPRYIELIAKGRYDEAYMINREANMFPSICGRVCMHPCESECNRQIIRGTNVDAKKAVQIMVLKRFAADYSTIIKERKKEIFKNEIPENAKKVAIVGSGPAGLAAANDLAIMKYNVTVFERDTKPGGLMMTCLPNYRIPKDIVELEISFIEELGVKIETGVEIGNTITLDELKEQGFEAIFIAAGMQKSRKIGIENEDVKGVYDGLTYLKAAVTEKPVTGNIVLIIGGGNVAMDAARTAVRLGAKEVHVACLEKWEPGHKDHMPASEHEYIGACEEGVKFHFSRSVSQFVGDDRIKGIIFKGVTSVYESLENKRFDVQVDESVKEYITADIVVTTIGQTLDHGFSLGYEGLVERGRIVVNPETLQTKIPYIFAGGDAVTGPLSIISAVATGHKAAISIDRYLRGKSLAENREEQEFAVEDHIKQYKLKKAHIYNWEAYSPSGQVIIPPPASLMSINIELELGFTKEIAIRETERCMQCNNNWTQDTERCIYCRGCVDVCPQDCLALIRLYGDDNYADEKFFSGGKWHEPGDSVISHDSSRCIRCGMCSERCPASVIYFEKFGLRRNAWKPFLQNIYTEELSR